MLFRKFRLNSALLGNVLAFAFLLPLTTELRLNRSLRFHLLCRGLVEAAVRQTSHAKGATSLKKKKKQLYLSFVQSHVQWNWFSALDPSSSEEQWGSLCAAPRDQIQMFIGAFGQRHRLDNNPRIHVLDCGRSRSNRREQCKPRPSCCWVMALTRPLSHHAWPAFCLFVLPKCE